MGNYLIALGGLVIFSIFSLMTNSSILNNKKIALESEFVITATSIAQSIIEEAKNKSFDQNTVIDTVTVLGSLSSTLGREGSESTNVPLPDVMANNTFKSSIYYNDIDDYNGYSRTVSTPYSGNNTVSVQVSYVSQTSPDSVSASRTWFKKMTVTVTNPLISVPIALTHVFTYH